LSLGLVAGPSSVRPPAAFADRERVGPYLVGAPPEVQAAHARLFGRTKALPPMGDPPAPDANHRVLQGLLGLVALLGSPRRRASAVQ